MSRPEARERGVVRSLVLLGVLAALGLLMASAAEARPGGGHSYSGGSRRSYSGGGGYRSSSSSSSSRGYSYSFGGSGSSGSGSGSTGGGGDLDSVAMILMLVVIGGAVILGVASYIDTGRGSSWTYSASQPSYSLAPRRPLPVDESNRRNQIVAAIRARDASFSLILFEDFAYGLYIRAHEARGKDANLHKLSPYLPAAIREQLGRGREPDAVSSVVVGGFSINVGESGVTGQQSQLVVDFESNYVERYGDREVSYYAAERWTLVRAHGVTSRPPDRVWVYNCPNCDAPLPDDIDDDAALATCQHCDSTFSADLDWVVYRVRLLREELRGPLLGGYAAEVGTDDKTRYASDRQEQLEALLADDPQLSVSALDARVQLIFGELNRAWSDLTWADVRPLCTDRFYGSQTYWLNAYRSQGLRNVIEQAKVTELEIVKVQRDPYFDALTIRVHAESLDYTIQSATDILVGGSRKHMRAYTEYWTLVRSAKRRGQAHADKRCPNCGAPELKVNMVGQCEHCEAKITGGEFDWVLSRIEQDEAYRG